MSRLYKNIVILTGAGISAESGLATFRSSNGLWNNHRVEDVATVEGFQRNPALVHDFYNELKIEIQKAKPNPAHLAITKLQKEYPGTVSVITQNVDTLHEKAGNTNICHIHGQINQAVCLNCGHILETFGDVDTETTCPQCGISGMMKPNIVFFGENLLCMDKVEQLLQNCDLFISGRSLCADSQIPWRRHLGIYTRTNRQQLLLRPPYLRPGRTNPAPVRR